jgi:hypothetical protein
VEAALLNGAMGSAAGMGSGSAADLMGQVVVGTLPGETGDEAVSV